ncbi:MAG TPA: DNA repair exonuclease [Thermoplasmata archaeon]|nr:DNA repair exonuclease [Thermoplasmata archaeon]
MGRDQFTFAHLADAHVGAWARNPALRDRLRQSVLRAIEVAQERGAEFLLISGDLFHTPVPEPSEVAPVAAALRRFVESGRRIYVIYGSHDYVAHRTSWLDVLAEAGVFVRVAPEAVRAGEARWTLPWTEDVPTGARVAGVSGRSHGLDREYYRSMDSTAFEAEPGFHIFQFHAGVEEYLPAHLRDKIKGIRVEDLPAGIDYYAGGHIHYTYEGTGPGGGLLVNPGAVFGTSRTDIENGEAGRTHRGVVIVTVNGGTPRAEFVDTLERGGILTLDVDISGAAPDAISELIAARVREVAPAAGILVLPRLHGTLAGGRASSLDLAAARTALEKQGITIQVDARNVESSLDSMPSAISESTVETEEIGRLLVEGPDLPAWIRDTDGVRLVRDLLQELGIPKEEGQSTLDYDTARRTGTRRLLDVADPEVR